MGENGPELDRDDEIIRDTLIARGGEVINGRLREILDLPPLETPTTDEENASGESAESGETANDVEESGEKGSS